LVGPLGSSSQKALPETRGSPLLHVWLPLGVILMSLAPGLAFLRVVDPPDMSGVERIGLGGSLGLGIVGTLIAWLALAGLFSWNVLAVSLFALFAGSLVVFPGTDLKDALRSLWRMPDGVVREARACGPLFLLGAGVVGLSLCFTLAKSLVPPWYPDALYYQLTLPRLYLEAGGFIPLHQEPVTSAYPGLLQMLFAIPLAYGRDDLAACFSWIYYPLLLVATAFLTRNLLVGVDRRAASRIVILAVMAVASVPQIGWIASVPLVDVATAAYLTCALHAVLRTTRDGSRRWALVAALSMGLALSTKYLAAPAIVLLMGALVVASVRRRGVGPGLRWSLVLLAVVSLPFVPWAIKNQRAWGTFLFPFHCPTALAEPVKEVLRSHSTGFLANSQAAPLPLVPFDLTFAAHPDDQQAYQGEVGPLPLVLLAVPLLLFRRGPGLKWPFLYVFCLFLVWCYWTRQIRFLFPVLAPLSALCLVPAAGREPAGLGRVVLIALVMGQTWLVGYGRPAYDLPYLLGKESRASYYRTLAATGSLFEACEALDHEPKNALVMFFWEYRGYLCPRGFLPEHSHVLYALPRSPEPALARMRELGVTHLLLNRTIWEEAMACGRPWPFRKTFEAILHSPDFERIETPHRPGMGQKVELFRIKKSRGRILANTH